MLRQKKKYISQYRKLYNFLYCPLALLCKAKQGGKSSPKAIFLLFVFLILFFWLFSSVSAGNLSDAFIEEHEKQIIRESNEQAFTDRLPSVYKEERELISRQMEIITGDEETRYIIVPGDTLTVSYKDRNEIKEAVYQISGKGEIHMPLIGVVKVSGLNRKQARENLNILLKEYIRHPGIKININAAGKFIVVGAVHGPGVYRMESGLKIMEAILNAGYIKESANIKSIVLMRGGVDDPVISRLDLKKMIKKGVRSDNVHIKPGDIIYVPTTFISNLDKFQRFVFKKILTYYGWRSLIEDDE